MPTTRPDAILTTTIIAQPMGPSEPEPDQPQSSEPTGTESTNAGLATLLQESQSGVEPIDPPAEQPTDQPADQPASTDEPNSFTSLIPDEVAPSTLVTPNATNTTATEPTITTPTTPAEWIESLQARFEGSPLPGMLLAVGVLIMMFIMMRRLARRSSTPKARSVDTAEHIASVHDSALSSIPPLERSVAHAEETARRLAALLDNKADRIDLLIQEADAKLLQLNNALAQVARSTPVAHQSTPQPAIDYSHRPPTEPDPHDAPRPAQRKIDPSLLDRARVEQDRAERTNTNAPTYDDAADHAPSPARNPNHQHPRELNITEPAADPTHRRIWQLSDDGVAPIEIARTLNQPIGQIELILNLRKSG